MKRLSIKFKVTFWFTLMMVVTVALVLVFLITVGEKTVYESSNQKLISTVERSFSEIKYRFGELDIDSDLDYYSDGVYIAIYTTEGELIYGRLPSYFDRNTEFDISEIREADTDQGRIYVYDAIHDAGRGHEVLVRGVMPASGSERAFEAIIRLAWITLPSFVIIAALIGYLITKRAFRPVAQIVASAAQINSGNDLSKRIEMNGSGDEIHKLAMEFDSMFDRLQESFENEKRFTSDASHELRTPVAVIIAECEALLAGNSLSSEDRQAVEAILAKAEGMAALISSLLTLARADRGHLKLIREEIDLTEAVTAIGEQVSELAMEKKITVSAEIEEGVSIQGDLSMITRMLLNLCENAIKYGRDGGRIDISLSRREDMAVITVADDGIGIAEENLNKIFQRFFRVDEARTDGSGLGLPLAKYIANAHGGDISVESELNKGSKFTATIPLKKIIKN